MNCLRPIEMIQTLSNRRWYQGCGMSWEVICKPTQRQPVERQREFSS
jgi:hypothetical protein